MATKQFPVVCVSDCPEQISVMRVEVSNVVVTDQTAKTLADELMYAARFFNHGSSTTVWIEVVAKHLPSFLEQAIERFRGFGIGLVVTHAGACSHSPGPLLPVNLRQRISDVNRSGQIWHPLAKVMVNSMPQTA